MHKLLLGMIVVLGWLGASMAHAITVTFNGTNYTVDSFTISQNPTGVVITTAGDGGSGDPVPDPDPIPDPDPTPTPDPDPAPVPNGSCVESSTQECGVINWAAPGPRITTSVSGTNSTISWQFITTSNPDYSGDINVSETVGNEFVSRRLWISTEPGGAALASSRCSTEGTSARKINWAQRSNFLRCTLTPNTTYFVNVKNVSGCSAGRSCGFYRNMNNSGNP
ncbi:hypothetical protein Q6D67_12480 [Haliea sp. E1-2-M8]|uniref:hypothetical protein n=1 Tax=Haliea sp. E1-2-M8 TaxID=3064706 RepID=UPI0027186C7C|nr:hypothetical protein [Haliea sp. E1-2-M8]MDO8862519.1 hypothetical protein [Haliea sp. E1-2-M8]